MEKINIVKRRKKNTQEAEKDASFNSANNLDLHKKKDFTLEEIDKVKEETLSFDLTPKQCEFIQSSEHVKGLLDGKSSGSVIDIRQHEEGHIVFRFNLERMDTIKMLKSEHVCQMLQISKSFLTKLVKEKKIKSYKVGRLRRFSLDDILNYLTENVELGNSKV